MTVWREVLVSDQKVQSSWEKEPKYFVDTELMSVERPFLKIIPVLAYQALLWSGINGLLQHDSSSPPNDSLHTMSILEKERKSRAEFYYLKIDLSY